ILLVLNFTTYTKFMTDSYLEFNYVIPGLIGLVAWLGYNPKTSLVMLNLFGFAALAGQHLKQSAY
ncbi:MAG: hypothetical protein NWP47_01770, partial [Rickettsiaceae bacterium]|nr:hypothetical protein [Rickettsiaceae bacterium]